MSEPTTVIHLASGSNILVSPEDDLSVNEGGVVFIEMRRPGMEVRKAIWLSPSSWVRITTEEAL